MVETHYLYRTNIKLLVNHTGRQHRYMVSKKLPSGEYSEPMVTQGITSNLEVIPKDLKGWAAWLASDYWYKWVQEAPQDEGADRRGLLDIRDEAANAYKVASHKGKTGGTSYHEVMEAYFKDGVGPNDTVAQETKTMVAKTIKWWEATGWKAVEAEKPCYSLSFDYATKIDLYAQRPDGTFVAINWKSNKVSRIAPGGVYFEAFIQGGGEALALMEQGSPVDEIVIINPNNVDDDGNVKAATATEEYGMSIDDCIHVFSLCRALSHDLDFFNRRKQ